MQHRDVNGKRRDVSSIYDEKNILNFSTSQPFPALLQFCLLSRNSERIDARLIVENKYCQKS